VPASGTTQVKAPARPAARGGARSKLAVATILMAVAGPMTTVAMPTASAAGCPDIEVVFARGTNEPPGIGVVGQALVDSLRPLVKGKKIGTYAVKYPASWNFMTAARGANDASARVQTTAARCPDTKIVLGGYSQGAAVIDVVTTSPVPGLGFSQVLPPALAKNVAAVAVFGNPSARIGQPLTIMSPLYGAKTADLCNVPDPICSRGDNFSAHTQYPQSGLVKVAAKWVAAHVDGQGRIS
jgi:cutinase